MTSATTLRRVETIVVAMPRDVPYLGPFGTGEGPNERGYFVRRGNRTVYPVVDRSVLVRVESADGHAGWGETYGIVVPQAVVALIDELYAPFLLGRSPDDPQALRDELYDLQRVRGASSGLAGDAIAALDIALNDLAARRAGLPLWQWLGRGSGGGRRDATRAVPAYVSGLPAATRDERVAMARQFVTAGFRAIKIAAPAATDGVVEELAALRDALGDDVELMADLHWRHTADEALALAARLAPLNLRFIEAPCASEDIAGLARVAAASPVPIAAGEEWHNRHEAAWRLEKARLAVVQPEIAHTGVGEFMAIGRMARAAGAAVMPHATIGVGVFLAASLHAAVALGDVPYHEYQHSILHRFLPHLDGGLGCEDGHYRLPAGPGHGVAPRESLWRFRAGGRRCDAAQSTPPATDDEEEER